MSARGHGPQATDEEISTATRDGLIGAVNGACVWGSGFLALGLLGHVFSPVYRRLTLQFKVYLQMSGMTVGAMVEADKRYRDAEKRAKAWRKFNRDQAVWRKYQEEFGSGGQSSGE